MEDRANDNIQDLFSDTESDIKQFEGFDARDIRPYVEIACKAPLFCPTPVPKVQRVHIESNDSSTSSLNDNESIATVDNLTLVRTSSSSSLEDELAPGIFRYNPSKSGASLSQATVNQEETEESSGSVERETFVPIESKEPLQAKTTEETKEPDTPNLGTRRRGKTKL